MGTGLDLGGGLFKRDYEVDDDTGVQLSDFKGVLNGSMIRKDTTAAGANSTVHTVTTGKTFFLTSMELVANSTAAGAKSVLVYIDGTDKLMYLLNNGSVEVKHQYLTMSLPLKLTSGQTIVLSSSSANLACYLIITGYEI